MVRIAHRQTGGLVIPERIIFDYELVLIVQGRGFWVIDGARRPYAAHDLLFIPPFTPHSFQGDSGGSDGAAARGPSVRPFVAFRPIGSAHPPLSWR